MTYKQIPFNIEIAKLISNGTIEGKIILDGRSNTTQILSFNLKSNFPIAAIVKNDYGEEIVQTYNALGKNYGNRTKNLALLVPSTFNDYFDFKPQKYESCLVKDDGYFGWSIKVTDGNQKDGKYTFFTTNGTNNTVSTTYKYCVPLNDRTIKLLNTTNSIFSIYEKENKNELLNEIQKLQTYCPRVNTFEITLTQNSIFVKIVIDCDCNSKSKKFLFFPPYSLEDEYNKYWINELKDYLDKNEETKS